MAQDNKKKGLPLLGLLLASAAGLLPWISSNKPKLDTPQTKTSSEDEGGKRGTPDLAEIERTKEEVTTQEPAQQAASDENLPVLNISVEFSQTPSVSMDDGGRIFIDTVKEFNASDYKAVNLTISEIAIDGIVYSPVSFNITHDHATNNSGYFALIKDIFQDFQDAFINWQSHLKSIKNIKDTLAFIDKTDPTHIRSGNEFGIESMEEARENLQRNLEFKEEELEGFTGLINRSSLEVTIENIQAILEDGEYFMEFYVSNLEIRTDNLKGELEQAVSASREDADAIVEMLDSLRSFSPRAADDKHKEEIADFCYVNLGGMAGIGR